MLLNKKYIVQIFTTLLAFSFYSSTAQIVGNGKMITKKFELEDVYKFESNIYADITIDMDEELGITIAAEENIINFIGMDVKGGSLNIGQKKWIEPSRRIMITIGMPSLREVLMDTHDELKVINVSGDIFKVFADIGEVVLSGEVDDIRVNVKNGTIEASKLKSRLAEVKINGDGRVTVNASENIKCSIGEYARLINLNKEAKSSGCSLNTKKEVFATTRYIDLKIKNNSWSRRHFVVVGPKPNGRSFSYGFPMMPGAVKSERWTIGTKVFKENSLGMRELLVILTEENEGEIVKLFNGKSKGF